MGTRALTILLLLLTLILTLLPQSATADCIPCRYGASTVVCPQPAGVDPANAMTDFACLCSKRSLYESTLARCFSNSDLPSSCSASDTSEHSRIRDECSVRESTGSTTATAGPAPPPPQQTQTQTRTETEKVTDTRTVEGSKDLGTTTASTTTSAEQTPPSLITAGGVETTFVQGEETYTVTYYVSSSSEAQMQTPKSGSIASSGPASTAGSTGGGKDGGGSNGKEGEPRVGTMIGAAVGGVVGVIVLGIAAVEGRKFWRKRRVQRQVEQELKEVLGAHLIEDGAAKRELPRYRMAELAGERRVAELPG
ncbi:hypothetical protein FN846DRAFT_906262 [Sphaerosporella brunnea]|uniref:Extracellular membrane protein CFEM domain-containing protein n=1 Tax=Sphaerosporella brunnea TaxID=1250544 RepID=A0A5J5EZC4_9PEZI|nr:hypothetical protein FN846DRAFT_906262 [Sphaerosporella brunnea]